MTDPRIPAPETPLVPGKPLTAADSDDSSGTTLGGVIAPIVALSAQMRDQTRLFVGVVAIVWTVLVLGICSSLLSVATASALVSRDGSVPVMLTGLIATVVGIGIASWTEQWFAHVLAYRVIDTIRLRVHRAIARLAPLGLARRTSGDTISAAMTDAESLEWFYAHTAAQVVAGAAAGATVSIGAVVWLGPVGLLLPLAQVIVVAIPLLLLPTAVKQGHALRNSISQMSADALAARTSARESVLLGRLDVVAAEAAEGTRRIQRARRALAVRGGIEQGLIEATTVAIVLAALVLSVRAVGAGELDPAIVPVLVTFAGAGVSPAMAITGALGKLGESSAAASRVHRLITTAGVRPTATRTAAGDPETTSASVEISALTVRYPEASDPAVHLLDLTVADGETLAIVGPSGAGKSTIALALARLIAEESGRILIGGVDVATRTPEQTRQHVILVGQHAHIFHADVRDNLLCPEASDPDIWNALENARLADHVRGLPDGLDTMISERGATWSGGERQRLGLARGLLREPDVLVLDEPTAGLDPDTEDEFLTALRNARRDRTTIIVSHRVAVMRACDRVALLDAGRILATGHHDQLVETSPAYRKLIGTADDGDPAEWSR
ncbi:amino acid ABC transporter ATP-binding/permease protein [Gordonia polyisoprenivorans]|uniref:amino acid ABC transporter ATP-binding/permease protein n=1 Tax=Gordonia polyisoprenivorans TaxID=84595 RepID=UPI001AD7B797|nr:ABC transporter ATP-binding protein [Gordonia polyisoprenivorans]QTI70303.1 ABC transporter ATP-binding protein [Gordonia polyisoprenivorans]